MIDVFDGGDEIGVVADIDVIDVIDVIAVLNGDDMVDD